MIKPYDSSRRKKVAAQTRDDIVQAALKLHWQGITEFGPLAEAAGCSLATVRKHFPGKDALFRDCTRTYAETLVMPDPVVLGAIADPEQRLGQSVSELCRIHEAMFGYAWLCVQQRKNFPTLDSVMNDYEGLADAISGIIEPAGSPNFQMVRGLLDFLTYRALRLSAGLSPQLSREQLITTIQLLT